MTAEVDPVEPKSRLTEGIYINAHTLGSETSSDMGSICRKRRVKGRKERPPVPAGG